MHKCVILLIFGNIKGSYNLNGRNMSEKIFTVIFKVVKSFIEILLIYGINYRQLNQIVKLAYVDIVMNNYGIRGRKSNNSRISVITGITRKEVMKIVLDHIDSQPIISANGFISRDLFELKEKRKFDYATLKYLNKERYIKKIRV